MTAPKVGALAMEYMEDVSNRTTDFCAALADLRALMAQAEAYRSERDRMHAILADNLPRLERIIGADRRDARLAMEALRDHASGINAVRAALAECGGGR